MALVDGQVQVRDLVMGPGTDVEVLAGFDPWSRSVRADQGDKRAWNDGAWSGAEWTAEAVVPIPLRVRNAADRSRAGWLAVHQRVAAAFAPSHDDLELRFAVGGSEYVMFGRPRMVEPAVETVRRGYTITKAAFVALDPTIYSGTEHTATLGLPSVSGGLVVPVTAPATVSATVTAGRVMLANAGTASAGMRLRIAGPVVEPWVAVTTDAGTQVLRCWLTLDAAQWLTVDTAARTVLLNDVASRRGQVAGDWPALVGTSEIAFNASVYAAAARLTVTWRDAWH